MKTRKLVLIIADVILLAVCILQGILAKGDGVKYFRVTETPDEYTIVTPAESIHLVYENEKWMMNGKCPVMESTVSNFTDSVESIRALDKVASSNEVTNTKYELIDGKKISVEVKKAGKVLRTLEIGKDATSGSQNYITVDGGKEIYLAAGNLRTIFDKTISGLRDRYVWGVDKTELNSVSITDEKGNTWSVSRMGSGDDVAWNISGAETEGLELDLEKTVYWFETLAIMTSASWYPDETTAASLGGVLTAKAKIGYGFKTISLEIYKLETAEGENAKYYGTSSETPYIFEIPDYQVSKYLKKPAELAK